VTDPDAPRTSKRIKKTEMIGKGCAVQGLALLLPFVGAVGGPVGIVVGVIAAIAVFVMGSRMSIVWKCGACKNPLASGEVTVCPSCHAALS